MEQKPRTFKRQPNKTQPSIFEVMQRFNTEERCIKHLESIRWPEGLTSQLQATYLGVRPLTEDRSIKSPAWVEVDLTERYQLPIMLSHGRLEAFFFVRNLLDAQWEQAIFAFESRLRSEPAGVTDIHFAPGNPRMFLGGVAWYF